MWHLLIMSGAIQAQFQLQAPLGVAEVGMKQVQFLFQQEGRPTGPTFLAVTTRLMMWRRLTPSALGSSDPEVTPRERKNVELGVEMIDDVEVR
jgi:hypothetical protein